MKYVFIGAVLAILTIGIGAVVLFADSVDETVKPSTSMTLIFFDRSAMSSPGALIDESYRDSLGAIGPSRIRSTGDRVSAFLVHARTRGKADRLDRALTQQLEDETRGSSGNRAMAVAKNREAIEHAHEDAGTSLLAFTMESDVSRENASWTDLWGTLEVISDEVGNVERDVLVYYFSDMYESMPGEGRRDFHVKPPQSRSQAVEWASADVAWLEDNMAIRSERLANVRIRVLLGRHGDLAEAPHVRAYWETLFEGTGVPRDAVRYN